VPASAVSARAAAAIDRALTGDPRSPLAHVALGVRCFWEFDREGASAAWNRAFELAPNDADVRVFCSLYNLTYMRGQNDDALAMLQDLVNADPRSAHLRAHLSVMCSWARQFDRATLEARRGLELVPDQFYATWALLFALGQSEPSEGIEFGLRALDEHGRHAWLVMGTALAARHAGRPDLVLALRDELEARARSTFVQLTPHALAAEAAGDEVAFFSLLDRAITERDPMLALVMGHSPMLDRYRERPEFRGALHRMGWDRPMPRVRMVRANVGEPA
jgi:tetratricopeptide (TPR) repeat protein